MKTARAYEEVVNFIATQTARNSLIAFHPSEQAKERVMELIQKEKESGLATDEKSELDHYMQLEHLMRLAKARAKQFCFVIATKEQILALFTPILAN